MRCVTISVYFNIGTIISPMVYSGLMNVVLDSFDIRAIVGDDDVRIAVPGEVL